MIEVAVPFALYLALRLLPVAVVVALAVLLWRAMRPRVRLVAIQEGDMRMLVANVLKRTGEDMRLVGNKAALKEIMGACVEALVRGAGDVCLHDTKGSPYRLKVECVEDVVDLAKLPVE